MHVCMRVCIYICMYSCREGLRSILKERKRYSIFITHREGERVVMALASAPPSSSFSSLCVPLGHRLAINTRFSCALLRWNVYEEDRYNASLKAASFSASRPAPQKRFHVCAEASFSELAPTAAAVYGTLLLGGGLFACKCFHSCPCQIW